MNYNEHLIKDMKILLEGAGLFAVVLMIVLVTLFYYKKLKYYLSNK